MTDRRLVLTLDRPHIARHSAGYWYVWHCGIDHLDRAAMEWVLTR